MYFSADFLNLKAILHKALIDFLTKFGSGSATYNLISLSTNSKFF